MNDMLKEFVAELPSKIKQNIMDSGSIMPVVFVLTEKGVGIVGIPEMPENPMEKEELADTIRKMAKEQEAVGIVMVSEAWGVELPKDVDLRTVSKVSKMPNRKEIVFIREEYKDVAKMTTYDIIRDSEGKVADLVLADTLEEEVGKESGIFTDFLGEPRGLGSMESVHREYPDSRISMN